MQTNQGAKQPQRLQQNLTAVDLLYTYLEYPQETASKMDANRFLMADAEQFKAAVQTAQDNALAAIEAERLEAERQEKQLEILKQLPADKFSKLLKLLFD